MNINGSLLKNVDGEIWKFGKKMWKSKKETWFMLKGAIRPDGRIQICINGKLYRKHRLIYKLANPEWDIDNSASINTIDHINIDYRDNSLDNLRVATMVEQSLNRKCMATAKGYHWRKDLQKWHSKININGKSKHLGLFEKEEDAKQAYLNAVSINRAPHALL